MSSQAKSLGTRENKKTLPDLPGCWRTPDGGDTLLYSFSLLTLNADGHPVMGRFHGPEDEKRSLVVIPEERREAWLQATPKDAFAFIRPMPPEEFTSEPSPRAARKSRGHD